MCTISSRHRVMPMCAHFREDCAHFDGRPSSDVRSPLLSTMVRSKGVGSRRASKKTTRCNDDPPKSMPETKKQKRLTVDNEEDTSTTKAFQNSGQKRLDLIKSWIKRMSSLQTANMIDNLISTVSQLQQLTADINNGIMAKGIVDANMEMIREQGLLVDLTAITDEEIPIDLTTAADEQIPVNLTTMAGEQILTCNERPADIQHDASLLLTRFLQEKHSSPNKYIPC
jgi:hypothetical protein